MKQNCGCCEGTERVTPVSNKNRPGLSALVYRAGTHATFLETMLARLTSHSLRASTEGGGAETRPLLSLRTRETEDASVAFLDAWATVADVLTFYQERIANEGYLRTATERRSVNELANLVGYRPRPGVSASAYLAYTLEDKTEVTIAAGSKAASTPGPGELPQTFETAEDLYARAEWNVLLPRLTRPQSFDGWRASRNGERQGEWTLYLKGTSTNLKPNDPVLIDYGVANVAPELFRVHTVEPDQANSRTKVTLRLWTSGAGTTAGDTTHMKDALARLKEIAEKYRDTEHSEINPSTATARRVLGQVDALTKEPPALTNKELLGRLKVVLPKLREEHRLAREGGYTKLEPWIGGLVEELSELPALVAAEKASATSSEGDSDGDDDDSSVISSAVGIASKRASAALTAAGTSSLADVLPLVMKLTKPPSAQPRSSQQLDKSVARSFAPASDNLARLVGAFIPGAGEAINKAWGAVPVTRRTPAVVYALRARASVFGNTAPPEQIRDARGVLIGQREWTLRRSSGKVASGTFKINITPFSDFDGGGGIRYAVEVTGPGGVSGKAETTTPFGARTFVMTLLGKNSEEVEKVNVRVEEQNEGTRRVTTFDFQNREVLVTVTSDDTTEITGDLGGGGEEPTESPFAVSLDAAYNKILPGSFAVIERPPRGTIPRLVVKRVERVGEVSRSDYSTTGKVTQLQIEERGGPWIDTRDQGGDDFSVIRNANVFAESEALELADAPIDPVVEDVCGSRVELGALVSGLEAGRWVIVSGERTDIAPRPEAPKAEPAVRLRGDAAAPVTFGTAPTSNGDGGAGGKEVLPGVKAAELVMLSGVEQSYDKNLQGDSTHTTLLFEKELAYCYRRDTLRVYANVVRATHGETRAEVLGSGDASAPMQTFALKQSPLTYVSAPTASGVESTLRVRVNDILWHETDTLAGLKPLDREYVTKTDEAGATSVVFGNGREGARLPTGNENAKAVYRFGIGKPGNLKAGQINQPTTKPLGVKEVTNPLASTGGADREGRDEARRNAPLAVMALDRLVSVRDYEDFARTFAGVAKASAARLSDGRRRVVHVTIAGADDVPVSPDSDLFKNLREALHKFGDPFQPVELAVRYLKTLFVSANVKVHPDYLWESVEPKVRAALLERFGFDRRDLGQDALQSEAVAAAQSVEGVVYVDFDIFDDVAEGVSAEELLTLGEDLGLRARVRSRLAHVEADAALRRESRIRPAQLVLLTPLVPDTLILREAKR